MPAFVRWARVSRTATEASMQRVRDLLAQTLPEGAQVEPYDLEFSAEARAAYALTDDQVVVAVRAVVDG